MDTESQDINSMSLGSLSLGDEGNNVLMLKTMLVKTGYLTSNALSMMSGRITSDNTAVYDTQTAEAVLKFKTDKKLADGTQSKDGNTIDSATMGQLIETFKDRINDNRSMRDWLSEGSSLDANTLMAITAAEHEINAPNKWKDHDDTGKPASLSAAKDAVKQMKPALKAHDAPVTVKAKKPSPDAGITH